MIKLQFNFKLISKDNERVQNRQGRYFLSAKYKAFSEKVKLSALSQYAAAPLGGDVSVVMLAGFRDKRHCDCGNLPKGIMDDLQGICFVNDRQIKKLECIVLENEPRDSFIVTVEKIICQCPEPVGELIKAGFETRGKRDKPVDKLTG